MVPLRSKTISARVSLAERALLQAGSRAKGVTISRFVLDASLKEARALVGGDLDPGPVKPGPKGFEGKGWRLGLSLQARLKAQLGDSIAADWMVQFREALAKNDHIACWFCLEHCLPQEIKDIPERSQVKFLRSFMKALSGEKP